MGALADLDVVLGTTPGTVSIWSAPCATGHPSYTRLPDARHYAASTMKIALLVALHRAHESGELDLDTPVPVRTRFPSALPEAPDYTLDPAHEPDPETRARVGGTATLRWLAQRMIVRSSNLAANLVRAHLDPAQITQVWQLVGATHSQTPRGIEDFAARDSGLDNQITATDLGRLLTALAVGAGDIPGHRGHPVAGRDTCRAMLATLQAQERREDFAAGLPSGTRLAHKNGWITGVRHAAGVVFPEDAPAYTMVVCLTTPLAEHGDGDQACALVSKIAAAGWADRHAPQP